MHLHTYFFTGEDMTRDEIIEMARQAELTKTIDCCGVANKFCSQDQWKGNLSIFAKLVAQHEREQNAKICQELAKDMTPVAEFAAKLCAKSIEEQA